MALSKSDKLEIEKMIKKEVKDFLDTTQAHKKVMSMIKKELGNKDIDDKMVDVATKCIVELFKSLWTKRNFWENSVKSVKP